MKSIYLYLTCLLSGIASIANAQVSADFSEGNTSACGSLQVAFFDQSYSSAGAIINYSWDLGVSNSSLQNPGAIYTQPGTYTVCLTVTDVAGNTDTKCKEDLVKVLPSPVANFTTSYTPGCAPVVVDFIDGSNSENGAITNWLWDLGGSANVINTSDPNLDIVSTYDTKGNYNASLTVTDEAGCVSTFIPNDPIVVNGITPIDLDIDVLESCELPWIVQFANFNSDPNTEYIWDFGNGQIFEGTDPPAIAYTNDGSFDLTIFVENGMCRDTVVYDDIITTNPDISFDVSPQTICLGLPVTFTDISVVKADSVLWNFGDGQTSTEDNPQHIYDDAGCYDITLTRFTGTCSETTELSCLTINDIPKANYTLDNQFSCDLPTMVSVSGDENLSGTWAWSIDDALSSTLDSSAGSFMIDEFGDYNLSLTYTDEIGCVYKEEDISVMIRPYTLTLPEMGPQGCAPLTFALEDSVSLLSQNTVSWNWSVDNGSYTSLAKNPTFTIADTGRYDVQLIGRNNIGCKDTLVVEDYVRVGMKPDVEFTATPLTGCRQESRTFTDLSSGFTDDWTWDFGDGGTSKFQNPSYVFQDSGAYTVTLIASHNGCRDSLVKENFINILQPITKFSIVYNCEDPYEVTINNNTIGADSLSWTLELDKVNSWVTHDSIFGSYRFDERGNYPITHFSYSSVTGCEDVITDTIRIVEPIANYTVDTLAGCAPFTLSMSDNSQDAFSYVYEPSAGLIDTTVITEPYLSFAEGGTFATPALIVTDIHECQDTFRMADSVVVNQLDAQISYDKVICIPAEVDYVDMSTDLYGNIIYREWQIASGDHVSNNVKTSYEFTAEGIYDIEFRVEDDWGCKDSIILREEVLASELIPDFSYDSLGCTYGPIFLRALGDHEFIDNYEWEFSDGGTASGKNPSYTFTDEGVYSVCLTMYDVRGCSKQICKDDIINIVNPIAEFEGDVIFSTCPPLFTQFTNESQNANSYQWSFGDNSGMSSSESPGHVYTKPGSFTVTLIASSTAVCSDTLVKEGYVNVEGPEADFSIDYTASCLPQGLTLIANSTEPYNYIWDFGNGQLDTVPGLVMSDTTSYTYYNPGNYAPKLIVTDSKGCTRSFSAETIEMNNVELDFATDQNIYCDVPSTVVLENKSESTTADVNYTWMVEGTQTITSGGISPEVSVDDPGLYNVSLMCQYGGCNDTLKKEDFFEVGLSPQVSFDISDLLCENVSVTLENTSTTDYGTITSWEWQLSDGTTSDEMSPIYATSGTDTQVFSLTANTNLGCTATLEKSFEILPSVIADAGDDQLICMNEEILLNGSLEPILSSTIFYWNDSPDLSCDDCISPVAKPQDTTSYILTAVHPSGCVSTDTVTVNVAPVPSPEITVSVDSAICKGSSATIEILDFNTDFKYGWNPFIAGLDCYDDCPTIMASPEESTDYEVFVKNIYGCITSEIVRVEVESTYVDFLDDRRAICNNASTTLSVNEGANPVWDVSSELDCSACDTPVASPSATTYFGVTVQSPLGCYYRDSILVEVIPDGVVEAGEDWLICKGETIPLTGIGQGVATWFPQSLVADATLFETDATIQESTYLKLQMQDGECIQEDSLYVQVKTKAELEVFGDTICFGTEGVLQAGGLIDEISWQLNTENLGANTNLFVSPEETTTYMAVAGFRSCELDTAMVDMYVHEEIKYELEEYTYPIHLNDAIYITPAFDEERDYAFQWFPDTGLDCSDCPDPIIRDVTERVDYVLEIEDVATECVVEKQVYVRFINKCTGNVFGMPNIISLSSTNGNQLFGPITANEEEFISIVIMDRWGNRVFSTTDVNTKWDGTFHGSPVADGVYVYSMVVICPETQEEYQIMGDVTVVR